ncbi:MAG: bifunctional hydroxymethylpyrimidine kinase/phosphomethylpyrimidine kinase, partial [Xenococcaceae cyanobacterium]
GVTRVDAMSALAVAAQIEAVASDMVVDSAKTGMLLNREIIESVAQQIEKWQLKQLVVDPVMVSRTGAQLIDDRAIASLRELLFPKAIVVTPNRYEAQLLSGIEINSIESMKAAAEAIHRLGAATVLVKGGGLKEPFKATDVWFDGDRHQILNALAIDTKNTHGTGCTLSAAIAANLAKGDPLSTAITKAKKYVTTALEYSLELGAGSGPVGHFFPLLKHA